MCGIAGIISKNKFNFQSEIVSMCDIIAHRGPDGFGYYYSDLFVFGHRRLSIIDLSEKGKQPMKFQDKYVITFNGEIYNYLELKKELIGLGYTFTSDTDTEVVLAAFDKWGVDCLNRFNGMFAFALHDNVKNRIFCARDRFGVKPLYYTQIGEKFAFASEIKQFTVLPGWKAIANKARLFDFFTSGGLHDHTNETLFEQVFQLRGGENLIFNLTDFTFNISRWYNFPTGAKDLNINFKKAKSTFKNLFEDTVRLRLRSDVKVGSCLSGGLDSTSIVCVMNNLLKQEDKTDIQETVSSCFDDILVDEREFINEVIDRTNVVSHKVFPSFENLFPQLDKIIWHQDEPFGSTSVYSQWCVYEEASKNGMTVMLDGQGADEYLAGYSNFHQMHFRELFFKGKFLKLNKSLKNYRRKYNRYYTNPYKLFINEFLQRFFPQGLIIRLRNLFASANHEPANLKSWIKHDAFNANEKKGLKYEFPASIKGMSKSQLFFTSLPKLLHHQDRDSMAHSVESRAPFVDYRLVEFVYALPSQYKVNNAVTKYILRESLKEVIPSKIGNRFDKLGFATPQGRWFKENEAYIRTELENACEILHQYVNKEQVMAMFSKSAKKESDNMSIFWNIICVSHWTQVFSVKL